MDFLWGTVFTQLKNSSKSFKVLIVGIQWPAETFIMRLIEGLTRIGMEITIVSKQKPRAFTGVSWIHPDWLGFFSLKKWDVIYFLWNSAAIEYKYLFDKGRPCVISCRGAQVNVAPHNPDRSSIKDGLKKTFEKAAKVHCVSRAILEEAMLYGLDRKKAIVITPAVDTFLFSPSPGKQSNLIVKLVTTGSLIWRKGLEYALMSIKKLINQSIELHLEIIGDGFEAQRVLYGIQDLGLQENVALLGKLSPDEVRDKLRQADIFILSSLSEGISNAALEAMSCGIPIVATDCGGMGEAVTDGVEGFIVPVRDADAMAEKIHTLIKSPELRTKMGQAARSRAEKDFKIESQIQGFVRLFHEAGATNGA